MRTADDINMAGGATTRDAADRKLAGDTTLAARAGNAGMTLYPTDAIADLYQPMRTGDWELRDAGAVLTKGYWGATQLVGRMIALMRGDDTWMSVTPMEIESQQIGVDHASGHVVVFGLGMGWSAAASALRPEVTHVTVVERDAAVIALHERLNLFARLPDGTGAKVSIVAWDAYRWRPQVPVDLLMPDIWLPLVSDGRVEEVQRMQDNVAATRVYFWGQEMEIARHAVAAGRALDASGIAATVAEFRLPLVGPDLPDYPARVAAAARAWMNGRWLPA